MYVMYILFFIKTGPGLGYPETDPHSLFSLSFQYSGGPCLGPVESSGDDWSGTGGAWRLPTGSGDDLTGGPRLRRPGQYPGSWRGNVAAVSKIFQKILSVFTLSINF